MNRKQLFAPAASFAAIALVAIIGSLALAADPAKDKKAAPPDGAPQLPPGWTEEDMKACIVAGTPGKNHQYLAQDVGEWQGKCTMWMAPGAEPLTSESAAKVTKVMDGRYTQVEHDGEMPGMGPYKGIGLYGYDNVSKKFVSTWIDNHSTGIMRGEGELSPDGKTLTWKYTYNCPLQKGPAVMREIETRPNPDSKTIEMHGKDPKSGKEYKMMVIELTRKAGTAPAAAAR